MAITDRPIIDKSSINADESANAFRSVMTQRIGYICREDIPDKGCDFDVELITPAGQATNWRFATQLKSIEKPTIVENGKFISYSFETSRLGYLLQRKPAIGMLVLYSVQEKQLYYELADALYHRLLEERGDDNWTKNNTVNVRVPIANVLDTNAGTALYALFMKRFENAEMMQLSHGAKYDLPTINLNGNEDFDFNSTDDVIRALKKYGISLLNSYDLDMVFSMVSKLPMSMINADKDLQIIAAVAFCEAGKHAEAAYYLDRLQRRTNIAAHETEMITFAKIKSDFSLGKIDLEQFYERCNELRTTMGISQNGITLDINLMHYHLLKLKPIDEIPEEMWEAIQQTYRDTEALNADEVNKALLKSWNTDNFSYLIGNARSRMYVAMRLRESLQRPLSSDEKKSDILKMAAMERDLANHLEQLQKRSKELEKPLLLANVILIYNRHRLSHEIDLISFAATTIQVEGHITMLEEHLKQAVWAYNTFSGASRFKEAHQSLCDTIDLIWLARDWHKSANNYNLEYFLSLRAQLETEMEIDPYKSPIPDLISQFSQQHVQRPPHPSDYMSMDDERIKHMSEIVCRSLSIPIERANNIATDMKAYRLFYNRCQTPIYQLLEYAPTPRSLTNLYEHPTKFVIRNGITGLETGPSTDIEGLLKQWRL